MKRTLVFFSMICGLVSLCAQDPYRLLLFDTEEMFNKYLLHKVHAQYDARDDFYAGPITEAEAVAHGERTKAAYLDILGQTPEKTPLKAEITAVHDLGDCIMENIVYESTPNRHVTANLYRPKAPGKYPAVIHLCGHGSTGKISEGSQATGVRYAANGIITMIIDPVSQGERNHLIDRMGNQQAKGGTTEHTLLHTHSLIVGQSTVKDELWDNVRGLDYLESRPEADADRLGCFGFSGGGTQSLYCLAFDDRIKVAGVGGFFTQRRRSLEILGGSDGCQHLPGEGEKEMELVDFLSIFAPKPVVLVGGHYCFVDWVGAEKGYKELRHLYDAYGRKDQVFNYFGDDGHAYGKDKQDVVINWFVKYLCGGDGPASETPAFTPVPLSDMVCVPGGNLSHYLPEEILTPGRNVGIWNDYAQERQKFGRMNIQDQRSILENTARIYRPEVVRPESRGVLRRDGFTIERLIVHAHDETPLPCLIFTPENVGERPDIVILAYESGKASVASGAEKAEILCTDGRVVVAVDLRGIGETTDKPSRNDAKFYNTEYTNGVISMHIGESLVAQRARDYLMVLDYLQGDDRYRNARSITVEATGKCTVPALHAAVYDQRITGLNLYTGIFSWKNILDNPTMWDQISYVVPNAGLVYDLTDLAAALRKRNVEVIYHPNS